VCIIPHYKAVGSRRYVKKRVAGIGTGATVLSAFESVENDLSGLRILAEQAQQLDIAVCDAIRGTEIALQEFQAGTVDYTTVAAAQVTQLNDQQAQLSVQENRLVHAVSLIADLGGGWSDGQLREPPHLPQP
jgi:outer membrane protein TolC